MISARDSTFHSLPHHRHPRLQVGDEHFFLGDKA
jgi:hypothetical protein